jgi:hypothetical protein
MIEVLVAAVPLLLLLGSLLAGYYPGCETIVRLAQRIGSRRSHPAMPVSQQRPSRLSSHAARGGLLIAFGHAQRPPPLAV